MPSLHLSIYKITQDVALLCLMAESKNVSRHWNCKAVSHIPLLDDSFKSEQVVRNNET